MRAQSLIASALTIPVVLTGFLVWSAAGGGSPSTAARASTPEPAAPTAVGTGSISGRAYSEDGTGQNPLVLVVLASTPQPIAMEAFLTEPEAAFLDSAGPERQGPGLIRPGTDGNYTVGGLAAGQYLVLAIAPFSTYKTLPPERVETSFRGVTEVARGFAVTILSGQSATGIDFVYEGPAKPEGPATIKVTVTTFDADYRAAPDRVLSVDVQPVTAGARLAVNDDGSFVLENVPAGTYTFTIRTARGFTIERELELLPGSTGEINLGVAPPMPSGPALPSAGSADVEKGRRGQALVALAGAVLVMAGIWAWRRRSGMRPN